MINKKIIYYKYRKVPLVITLSYVAITFLISIFGPIKYFRGEYKYWIVIPFILGFMLCFSAGYFLGLHTKESIIVYKSKEIIDYKVKRLLKISLWISICVLICEGFYLISIGHMALNMSNLGSIYGERIGGDSNLVIEIRFSCAIFRMLSLTLGFYCFNDSNIKTKALIIINILLYIIVFLFGYGVQKGISDIVIYFAVSFYIRRIQQGKKVSRRTIRIIILTMFLMLMLFSYMQYLRYAQLGIDATNFHLRSTGEYYFDTNNIIFKIFGPQIGFGMASIFGGYLSQGYYGLSLCLQLPFEWTYGVGNSYALTRLLEKIGIDGIFEKTYLMRMQKTFGRSALRGWNTIFPWLASDYTFIGALLIFVIIGYMIAKSWKEILLHNNAISYVLLTNLAILVLFIPANNQLFHGYDVLSSSWIIILFWLLYRKQYHYE